MLHGVFVLRIALIGVLVLFADALSRMNSITNDIRDHNIAGISTQALSQLQANRFYAQRNVYLTGFTLFLSLILTRTYSLILDLLDKEAPAPPVDLVENVEGKDKNE